MATYKVLQDIEAEDKLVGPLTLWQFIYALAAGLCLYLSGIAVVKSMPYFLIILVPIALFVGFLAIPWGGDQPTEVWALAKLRFFLKPRLRIWDQSGMTELVTVTAPKHEEQRVFTDGLSQGEVKSRLHALANTLDSRGWAVKNVNVNLATTLSDYSASDRLVDISTAPQEVATVDIRPDDDILDEQANPVAHTFSTMINQAASVYHKSLVDRMNQPLPQVPDAPAPGSPVSGQAIPPVVDTQVTPPTTQPVAVNPATSTAEQQPTTDYWFVQQPVTNPISTTTIDSPTPAYPPMQPILQAAEPTADEAALLEEGRAEEAQQDAAYGHLKTLKTPEQIEEDAQNAAATLMNAELTNSATATAAAVTSEKQAAIMNLSRSNDLNIDTLARQAKQTLSDDNEVVISLR